MALTMEEFAKLDLGSDEERKKLSALREAEKDAYWDSLSEIIDQHPIGLPGMKR